MRLPALVRVACAYTHQALPQTGGDGHVRGGASKPVEICAGALAADFNWRAPRVGGLGAGERHEARRRSES